MAATTTTMQSPFAIPHEDVAALEASQAFGVLRSYLARETDFCPTHTHCTPSAKQTFLLHRDILHALIMPVVTLFSRASTLASAALCSPRPADLELAFAGEARGAFLCLQCFITEESDWCHTRGCPACVVTETLSTDSHIRLTIAASLLSTAGVASPGEGVVDGRESGIGEGAVDTSRTLPPLPHILPALRDAVVNDPFWEGPDIWSYILSRATQLSAGIQALIAECVNLESLVSSPVAERPGQPKRGLSHPGAAVAVGQGGQTVEEKGVKLRKSKLAKRQLRMKDEEFDMSLNTRARGSQMWGQS
ncbi:hypothetical protein T440DRAFT_171164 [Plenodomus tracheiphilus IPT5]|uniref:Uncharacterized protein n=1 Tax=Plenodomus tracheiphilus IPT5 TaxID=1408161 RepID=A0A6A7B216_9PLEO|nr:hypothetical protein T440DRAFT_171164 [Plenodomus tracheiphilus IPT5]